jgi:hypothetical protein
MGVEWGMMSATGVMALAPAIIMTVKTGLQRGGRYEKGAVYSWGKHELAGEAPTRDLRTYHSG